MFRFTIRELLLLTVIVALGVAWWIDRNRLADMTKRYQLTQFSAQHLAEELEKYGWHFNVYPDGTFAGIQDAGAP